MADIGYVLLVDGGTIACDAIYNNNLDTAANMIMAKNPGSVLHLTTAVTSNQPFYGLTTVVDVGQTVKLFGGRASGTCASMTFRYSSSMRSAQRSTLKSAARSRDRALMRVRSASSVSRDSTSSTNSCFV